MINCEYLKNGNDLIRQTRRLLETYKLSQKAPESTCHCVILMIRIVMSPRHLNSKILAKLYRYTLLRQHTPAK